jgi:hypothetical protein
MDEKISLIYDGSNDTWTIKEELMEAEITEAEFEKIARGYDLWDVVEHERFSPMFPIK